MGTVKIRLINAWYDFWIGLYWDRAKRRLYVFPIPMVGLLFDFNRREARKDK